MSLHPHNIAQKTEVMVEHFRAKRHATRSAAGRRRWWSPRRGCTPCATSRRSTSTSRSRATRTSASRGVLRRRSKTPTWTASSYTEVGMNKGIKEKRAARASSSSDEYQVLLVANKYQTGFDQPLLHTMYVDKRLSRRPGGADPVAPEPHHPGKEDTFVLDFVNDAEEIRADASSPTTSRPSSPSRRTRTSSTSCSTGSRRRRSSGRPRSKPSASSSTPRKRSRPSRDQAEMYRALGPAVDRFKALDEEKQDEFRNALTGYVRLYGFLSQVMPFADADLEKLYTFGRFLELKLPQRREEGASRSRWRGRAQVLPARQDQRGADPLERGGARALRGPTEVGTRKAKDEEVALSEIIDVLNERFGTEFKHGGPASLRPVHRGSEAGQGDRGARPCEPARQLRAGDEAQGRGADDRPDGSEPGDREPLPQRPGVPGGSVQGSREADLRRHPEEQHAPTAAVEVGGNLARRKVARRGRPAPPVLEDEKCLRTRPAGRC